MAKIERFDVLIPAFDMTIRQMCHAEMWMELLEIVEGGDWKSTWSDEVAIHVGCARRFKALTILDSELDYADNHE